MNQPKSPDDNQASLPEPGIRQEADNSTFGGGQQAVTGNDNIQNQGNNNWLGNTWNVFFGQQTTPVGNPERPKNERILLAAVKEEVTARLRQSLHNAVLINLGKESQPQQVKRPWDAEIKIGLKPAVPLPDTTTILEVFDSPEIAGKLLILGAPGSGKTTTQLELAQALISRAEEQPDYPVPVLFNLSSWKDDRQSITDWLVTELKSKYGVSKKLGQEWVSNKQLLPLLDGLDELEPQRQELCVQAINQFLASENRPLYLAVCSRSEEYSNYPTRLQLNGAIHLQPLNNNQICDYLTSINSTEQWLTISSDLDLLELLKTPLLLSITVLASQHISVEEWQNLTSTSIRLQYLLDTYIGRMLTRNDNSRAYLKNKAPNVRKTRMRLIWLAQQMQVESKTEFLIEEMQIYLLKRKVQNNLYKIIIFLNIWIYSRFLWMLVWLFFFIAFHVLSLPVLLINFSSHWGEFAIPEELYQLWFILLLGGLYQGWSYWLLISLIFSIDSNIEIIDSFNWSWKKAQTKLSSELSFFMIIIWLMIVSIGVSIGGFPVYTYKSIIISGLSFGLGGGVTLGLLSGLKISEIETKSIPNQGIRRSGKNAVVFGVVGALVSLVSVGLSQSIFLGSIAIVNSIQIFGLIGGGKTCIQHFTLRLILYFNGYIPWNYARFLDYCTERLFLQRVGGRYRFIHKLLQDHFAQMEFRRD